MPDVLPLPATDARSIVEHARLMQLWALTPLPEGPHSAVLSALLQGGASSIGFAISPRGRSLGVVGTGRGDAFTDAVVGLLTTLLDAEAGAVFRTLSTAVPAEACRVEVLVGRPTWLRAGVRGISTSNARAALRGLGVSPDQCERLLDPALGEVHGVDLFSDGVGAPTLAVVSRGGPTDTPALLGTTTVEHTRRVDQAGVATTRRGGLQDRALIDWIVGQGAADGTSARRLGTVHGILETHGPVEMCWLTEGGAEDVVLVYRSPVG